MVRVMREGMRTGWAIKSTQHYQLAIHIQLITLITAAGPSGTSVKCGVSLCSSGVKSYTSHQRLAPLGSSPAVANCAARLWVCGGSLRLYQCGSARLCNQTPHARVVGVAVAAQAEAVARLDAEGRGGVEPQVCGEDQGAHQWGERATNIP